MNLQKNSERTDARRKPKHPRLELQRRRRRDDDRFLDQPDLMSKHPVYFN